MSAGDQTGFLRGAALGGVTFVGVETAPSTPRLAIAVGLFGFIGNFMMIYPDIS